MNFDDFRTTKIAATQAFDENNSNERNEGTVAEKFEKFENSKNRYCRRHELLLPSHCLSGTQKRAAEMAVGQRWLLGVACAVLSKSGNPITRVRKTRVRPRQAKARPGVRPDFRPDVRRRTSGRASGRASGGRTSGRTPGRTCGRTCGRTSGRTALPGRRSAWRGRTLVVTHSSFMSTRTLRPSNESMFEK